MLVSLLFCLLLLLIQFLLLMLLLFLSKSALFTNPAMSDLLTNPFCLIFKSSLTKLPTSGILFSTVVNAAIVAKPGILGILLSMSVILALRFF